MNGRGPAGRPITRIFAIACLVLACGCEAGHGGGASETVPHSHEDGDHTHDVGAPMDPNEPASVDAIGSVPAEVVCELGTKYPGQAPIDPDVPDFEEEGWTKAEVAAAFAADKAKNGPAYRAYKAAVAHQDVLECAFCACGCGPSIGHLSAIDCFKDMHGFDCGYCQLIAFRAESLTAQGLAPNVIRKFLQKEFPKLSP